MYAHGNLLFTPSSYLREWCLMLSPTWLSCPLTHKWLTSIGIQLGGADYEEETEVGRAPLQILINPSLDPCKKFMGGKGALQMAQPVGEAHTSTQSVSLTPSQCRHTYRTIQRDEIKCQNWLHVIGVLK